MNTSQDKQLDILFLHISICTNSMIHLYNITNMIIIIIIISIDIHDPSEDAIRRRKRSVGGRVTYMGRYGTGKETVINTGQSKGKSKKDIFINKEYDNSLLEQ